MCCMLKNIKYNVNKIIKYILLMCQNITHSIKNKILFNDPNRRRVTLYCSKTLPVLLRSITSKYSGGYYYLNSLYSFRTTNLNHI